MPDPVPMPDYPGYSSCEHYQSGISDEEPCPFHTLLSLWAGVFWLIADELGWTDGFSPWESWIAEYREVEDYAGTGKTTVFGTSRMRTTHH